MKLTKMKHSGNWEFLGRMLHVSGAKFERKVIRFIEMVADPLYETNFEKVARTFSGHRLNRDRIKLNHYRYA